MGRMSDLDIFIDEKCKGNFTLKELISEEIDRHLKGTLSYELMSKEARDVWDDFEEYMVDSENTF